MTGEEFTRWYLAERKLRYGATLSRLNDVAGELSDAGLCMFIAELSVRVGGTKRRFLSKILHDEAFLKERIADGAKELRKAADATDRVLGSSYSAMYLGKK